MKNNNKDLAQILAMISTLCFIAMAFGILPFNLAIFAGIAFGMLATYFRSRCEDTTVEDPHKW